MADPPPGPVGVAARDRYRPAMTTPGSLERRLAINAALAAAMTGALLALGVSAFAAVIGHPPSPGLLAALVVGAALASATASRIAVAYVPAARRALGLAPRRPSARR
jgi:hypothetical protein